MGCVFRMGFHTMGRRRPLSRFMLGVLFLIWMASAALLCQNPTFFLHTVAPSQLMQWLVFCTWTAMPFFGSPLRTACRCSLNLTFSVLFVSPTYTSSHSLQGISYTPHTLTKNTQLILIICCKYLFIHLLFVIIIIIIQ